MENSQALATESFSYSWLVVGPPPPNLRRVENGGDDDNDDDDNFHFDVPSSAEFANADEIFTEGQMIRTEGGGGAAAAAAPAAAAGRNRYYIIGKWSKKILRTCLGLVRCSSKGSRVDDLQRKVLEASSPPSVVDLADCDYEYYCLKMDKNSWRSSPTSTSSYVCGGGDDNGDESSIREAILYCKRSIEK